MSRKVCRSIYCQGIGFMNVKPNNYVLPPTACLSRRLLRAWRLVQWQAAPLGSCSSPRPLAVALPRAARLCPRPSKLDASTWSHVEGRECYGVMSTLGLHQAKGRQNNTHARRRPETNKAAAPRRLSGLPTARLFFSLAAVVV